MNSEQYASIAETVAEALAARDRDARTASGEALSDTDADAIATAARASGPSAGAIR